MRTEMHVSEAPYEAALVSDWLVNGKPELGWRGDPRLGLRVSVLTAANDGVERHSGKFYHRGSIVAHCYEVWRHNEDGTEKRIVQRKLDQWHEIIPALVGADPATPGHVSPVDLALSHNAKMEKDNSDEYRGWRREATEHLWRLVGERTHGRNTTYQVPGRNPDRQL